MFVNNASAVGRERGTYNNRLYFTMKLNFENDDLQPKKKTNTSSPTSHLISRVTKYYTLHNNNNNNHLSSKCDSETGDGPD